MKIPISGLSRRPSMRLFVASLLIVGLSASSAYAISVGEKISGELTYRVSVKKKAATLTKAEQKAFLEQKGIFSKSLSAESCALYVETPLTDAEVADLAAQGIRVNTAAFVDAVPPKHPYAFYLAEVDHSALSIVEADDRFVFLETTETQHEPMNNLGRTRINTDDVQAGTGVAMAYDGSGIKIAVADSGIDLTHPDFPVPIETYDMTDGTSTLDWGTNVSTTVEDHGTHVSGSAVGDGGLSGGLYAGGAPGADFYFYKIGNDINAGASEDDEVEALTRAVTVGADIFSMSYGGYDTYMDGTSPMCQAIDDAFTNDGVLSFISAGNSQDDARHYSVSLAPGGTSGTITFTVNNAGNASAYTADIWLRVIWLDNAAGDANVTMTMTSAPGAGEAFGPAFSGTSTTGVEARRYVLTPNVTAGGSKAYTFTVSNGAVGGSTPLVHIYNVSTSRGTFAGADSSYTVSNPAVADEAIAVGAWVTRVSWTDWQGNGWAYGGGVVTEEIAPFSSLGPRVDGTTKPDVTAPGMGIISTRDSTFSTNNQLRIDNDGLNVNGSGPADYYLKQGTSMACPLAAGSMALILHANVAQSKGLTPAELRTILLTTADDTVTKAVDNTTGYGLMDTLAAVQAVEAAIPADVSDWSLY